MRAIGIRVSPRDVFYAVVEKADEHEVLAVASVVVPPALDLPERLHLIRTTTLDLMAEYHVAAKGVRVADGAERNSRVLSGEESTRAAAHRRVRDALTNL